MKITTIVVVALAALGLAVRESNVEDKSVPLLFADVLAVCEQRQQKMSQHPFFKMLADQDIPARQRMRFVPYWAYFAVAAADVMDTWLYTPNPQNELEQLVNTFIEEDDFHYNLFLHDMEQVFGYTLDRFGSFSAVMRHLFGAESKAVRELFYSFVAVASKYNDPIVTLAQFEAAEACMKDFFETVYTHVSQAEEEFKELQYFGAKHIELERSHKLTNWFKGENDLGSLAKLKITPSQKEHALEAVNVMYERYVLLYM